MDESMDTVGQPGGAVEKARQAGVDRRTMLKAAVAAGTIAGTWVAPRVETLGFAPAAASHTPCIITSDACDDLNSNQAANPYCAPDFEDDCCGKGSFGDAGESDPDTITFDFPEGEACEQVVVRTIAPDCETGQFDPDIGAFAVVIDSTTGDCDCVVKEVLIFSPGQGGGQCTRGPLVESFNNEDDPFTGPCGPGVLVSNTTADTDLCALPNNSRLAVRIECTGIGVCPTP